MNVCFDYRSLAAKAGLCDRDLTVLETRVRGQYGSDEMMIELRLLRTLQAISAGEATLDDALREFSASGAGPLAPSPQ